MLIHYFPTSPKKQKSSAYANQNIALNLCKTLHIKNVSDVSHVPVLDTNTIYATLTHIVSYERVILTKLNMAPKIGTGLGVITESDTASCVKQHEHIRKLNKSQFFYNLF